jgi:hypothetical protein
VYRSNIFSCFLSRNPVSTPFHFNVSAYAFICMYVCVCVYLYVKIYTYIFVSMRQNTSAYFRIRQHISEYFRTRQHTLLPPATRGTHTRVKYLRLAHTLAYVSMRLHMPEYSPTSIRGTHKHTHTHTHTKYPKPYLCSPTPCSTFRFFFSHSSFVSCISRRAVIFFEGGALLPGGCGIL